MLEYSLSVPQEISPEWFSCLPSRPAVFALFGHEAQSEPYIAKTANLRKRMHRLLGPAPSGSRRLHLGGRVARLAYSEAVSPFATSLLLLQVTREHYGARAKERLHLRPPVVLRLAMENAYPRVYVTNRLTARALKDSYGPFQSRAAAERFLDDSLNLFELRRCSEELTPDSSFPGCVYSEMKMCLAPCFRGCTDERYTEEAQRVRQYLASRGRTTLAQLEQERGKASEALDFERAAQIHQRIEKLKAVTQQVQPLVQAIAELDAVVLQPASQLLEQDSVERVAVFLVRSGRIAGPAYFSVEGMRHPNEQSGSSSLFAHPTLLEPVPLESVPAPGTAKPPRGALEERLLMTLSPLETELNLFKSSMEQLAEHLSLLARWYYRPPAQRVGEIFFREEKKDGSKEFPMAKILRGISRVYCGQKTPKEAASEMN